MEIKVIALNDDNHCTSFATENTVYYDARRFMEACLLDPHNDTYVVRGIHICYPPEPFKEMDENDFIQMFELVEQKPAHFLGEDRADKILERTEAFNKLWEYGEETWH